MKRVVLVVVLAACGGKSSAPTTPQGTGTCDSAASNVATSVPDLDDAGMTEVANAIAGVCASDAWSPAAIGCFANAAGQDAVQACNDQLTPAQQDSLGAQLAAPVGEDEEDPMADEPEEPAMDDSELEE